MTEFGRYLFGGWFILWGLSIIFVLPSDIPAKFMNYVILGTYFLAIFWWAWFQYPWWVGYWISALMITTVVTFGDFTKKL